MDLIKNLDQWFKVELTYTSNAIEGNTLSRQETALVVEKGITVEGKTVNEHLEATNHAEALDYVRTLVNTKRADLTEREIMNIHEIILKKIDVQQRWTLPQHPCANIRLHGEIAQCLKSAGTDDRVYELAAYDRRTPD